MSKPHKLSEPFRMHGPYKKVRMKDLWHVLGTEDEDYDTIAAEVTVEEIADMILQSLRNRESMQCLLPGVDRRVPDEERHHHGVAMPVYRVHVSREEKRTNSYLDTAEVDIQAANGPAAIEYVNKELQEGEMELYLDWETKEISSSQIEPTRSPLAENAVIAPARAEAEFIVPEKIEILDVEEEFKETTVGYHKDLDDVSTVAMKTEIDRRNEDLRKGLCPYCGVDLKTHTCKYVGRVADYHKAPSERKRDR